MEENKNARRVSFNPHSCIDKNGAKRHKSILFDELFQDTCEYETLSLEEEIDLFSKIKNRNVEAKDRIKYANLRFVAAVSKQYLGYGLMPEELYEEGQKGLMKAIDTFDPSKGFKFISFAIWWIRQSILNALKERGTEEGIELAVEAEKQRLSKKSNQQTSNSEYAIICKLYKEDVDKK